MRTKREIKETGAIFTPRHLADFLTNEIIQNLPGHNSIKVLDPACGDGILLEAFAEASQKMSVDLNLIGYDADEKYLNDASKKLARLTNKFDLYNRDYLETFEVSKERNLFNVLQEQFDVAIANPPYVRTQVLGAEKARLIAERFNLKGRVDLYFPFLIGMTERLKVGGILGVITSKRYLYTKSGESIRQYLSQHYEIIKVIDFGDTKLFNAAVLPAIFIGRKIESTNQIIFKESRFVKIYEEMNGRDSKEVTMSVLEIINIKQSGCYSVGSKKYYLNSGVLRYQQNSGDHWMMLSLNEDNWIKTMQKNSVGYIKDFFKVRVGIKTTADNIFIRNDWATINNSPEKALLKPLISQDNIDKWSLSDKEHLEVLYTHFDDSGTRKVIDLEKYPKAATYLNEHREQLASRDYIIRAKRKWYEIWVPQNPSSWGLPKLVFPDISEVPRFYFDVEGFIVNGNCYWIAVTDKKQVDLLRLIQGVANSDVVLRYHELLFNNKLYSGKFRFLTQYVENYPVPDINSRASQEIISLVKDLTRPGSKEIEWQDQLNKLVLKAFSLDSMV